MALVKTRGDKYAFDFKALTESRSPSDWLSELRQRGWEHFDAIGFPTARRGNELWKYTNLAPLERGEFEFRIDEPDLINLAEIQDQAPWSDDWTSLVFVDGIYSEKFSRVSTNNPIRALNLSDAGDDTVLQQQLGAYASAEESAFTALNTAFLRDGAFVQIPEGHSDGSVGHLLFLTTSERSRVTYPRTLVVSGPNSQASIIETYISLGEESGFTAPVAEYVLGSGAHVDHYRVLAENEESFHIGTTRVYQSDNSHFASVAFSLGPKIGRNDIHTMLDATGAECTLNGLYFTNNDQHLDNHISTTHAKPHGTSHQFYKGVLSGDSRAVFSGRVLVEKDAQKTEADQKDLNLVLSHGAEIDTKPSLEIYADDVKCAHGATAGHTDPEALFYMQSRGIDQETAQAMLVRGFAAEISDTIGLETLRNYVEDMVEDTIPGLQATAD